RAAHGRTSRARQASPCPSEPRRQADLVVVSELRRVELAWGSTADLGFGCPPVTVGVRAVQLVRGPSAAQMETASSLPIQIAFEPLGADLARLVAAGAVQAAAELPEIVDVGGV